MGPVPLGNDTAENRRGLAEEAAGDERLAIEREANRLADFRIVERLRGAVRQKPVVAGPFESLVLRFGAVVTDAQSFGGISLEKFTSPDVTALVRAVTSGMIRYSIAPK
jgi:hypothetical protein